MLHHVVSAECRERYACHILHSHSIRESLVFIPDSPEDLLAVVNEVHLIHSKYNMPDTQQRHQISMTARLRHHTCTCIHKDYCQIGCGAARYHVSRILFVSRGVGYDELAFVGGEVAICHIDGDSLLALRLQSVQQQCVVDLAGSSIPHTSRIALQCRELVLVQLL